jgi:hypothetical protein
VIDAQDAFAVVADKGNDQQDGEARDDQSFHKIFDCWYVIFD